MTTTDCPECARFAAEHATDTAACVHEYEGRWYRLQHHEPRRESPSWTCLDLPRGVTISGAFASLGRAVERSARSYPTREAALAAFPPPALCDDHHDAV